MFRELAVERKVYMIVCFWAMDSFSNEHCSHRKGTNMVSPIQQIIIRLFAK